MANLDNKKPLLSDALAGLDNKGLESANADNHNDRITRFGILKHRSKQQENFLWTKANFKENYLKDSHDEESIKALKAAQKLQGCGNFLLFKNFYTIEQVKLVKFQVCNQHLLCPFCAAIRASRSVERYVKRVDQLLKENKKLKPVLITLTVKNGTDLKERFEHLTNSFKTLLARRRDYKKKKWGFNQFCKVEGAFYSSEYTYNSKTKEWHPHIHIFGLIEDWIDQDQLCETWHDITGDSYIVDVRRVKKEKGLGYAKGVSEVFKYALKFGDLSVENTWEAFKVLKGKRLTGSFGLLHGVKLPENLADDVSSTDDLPYLEMLYKFVFAKKSYYDLVITRHVEPQAQDDRPREKELRRPTEGESPEPQAQTDEAIASDITARVCGVRRGRKKQHWQVPPVTRVRVRQRIRRWDGFMCVLHM